MSQDLSWETWQIGVYDYTLFVSFIILVPIGAVATVISKLCHVQSVLNRIANTALERRQLAFDLQTLGLASR